MQERLEDIIRIRKDKILALEKLSIDVYPSTTNRTHSNAEVLEKFSDLQARELVIVGRIRSFRDMGKLIFVHIDDGTARVQVLLKDEHVGAENLKFFKKHFDLGDFAEFAGTLFETKTGEKTLQAKEFKMLAKSILPLPSEHFGIEDTELKLRKRYLDILLDPEVKEIFIKKNKFWQAFRNFLEQRGFLEVEMPILEGIPGGAEADPFITHHNALDRDFYLRISLELPLKKMLVAGYEKVFEIGRIFRNEGISTEHLQDYTQMEFYWAYGDFEGLLKFWQEMYQYVIKETFGTLTIASRGKTVDWSGEWPRVSYVQVFKEYTGLDLLSCSDEDLRNYADSNSIEYEDFAQRGRLIDVIFKKFRKQIPGDKPFFLIDQPIELEPLAKKDPKNPKLVQRAQVVAYGTELGKGFGELNDPIDQRQRFTEQAKLREAGDSEAQMFDEGYVEAMEYGMPPAAGFGVSERLFALLMDKSVRETQIFPLMKEEDLGRVVKNEKETPLAVVVVNNSSKLEKWQELNTVAHLNAAYGARMGKKLFYSESAHSKDGKDVKMNTSHAIIIKSANSGSELGELLEKAVDLNLHTEVFSREMINSSDDKKVMKEIGSKEFKDIELLGVLVFGSKKKVSEITSGFSLYS